MSCVGAYTSNINVNVLDISSNIVNSVQALV